MDPVLLVLLEALLVFLNAVVRALEIFLERYRPQTRPQNLSVPPALRSLDPIASTSRPAALTGPSFEEEWGAQRYKIFRSGPAHALTFSVQCPRCMHVDNSSRKDSVLRFASQHKC